MRPVVRPEGVSVLTLPLPHGPLAAVQAAPAAGASRRGTVLLVPGFTGSKEDFLPLLGPLAAAGFRAVAVDQRGQFESVGPPDPCAYTVAALRAELVAVADLLAGLDGAGRPLHLVGHSFGGLVARAAVIARPDLAASLTLLGSGPAAIPGERRAALEQLRPALAAGGLPLVWAAMQQAAATPPGVAPTPPEVQEFLARRFFAGSAHALQGMGEALLTEPDTTAELAAAARLSGVALLVACGAQDDAWPPALQEQMAGRLDAGFVVVDGAAHSPAVEQPERTAEVLLALFAGTGTSGPA